LINKTLEVFILLAGLCRNAMKINFVCIVHGIQLPRFRKILSVHQNLNRWKYYPKYWKRSRELGNVRLLCGSVCHCASNFHCSV